METQEIQKEVTVLEKKIDKFLLTVSDLKVTDEASMLVAGDKRREIKDYMKQVIETKESATKPLNGVLKTIRSWFSPIEEKCENSIDQIEEKMGTYNRIMSEKKRKEEIEAQKKLDETAAKLKAKEISEKQAERIVEKVEAKLEKAPDQIRSTDSFFIKKNRKVRHTPLTQIKESDLKFLVNNGYIVWDEVKSRRDALHGVKIPGTEIYEEDSYI